MQSSLLVLEDNDLGDNHAEDEAGGEGITRPLFNKCNLGSTSLNRFKLVRVRGKKAFLVGSRDTMTSWREMRGHIQVKLVNAGSIADMASAHSSWV